MDNTEPLLVCPSLGTVRTYLGGSGRGRDERRKRPETLGSEGSACGDVLRNPPIDALPRRPLGPQKLLYSQGRGFYTEDLRGLPGRF
jgi:hypothetical protein